MPLIVSVYIYACDFTEESNPERIILKCLHIFRYLRFIVGCKNHLDASINQICRRAAQTKPPCRLAAIMSAENPLNHTGENQLGHSITFNSSVGLED